ncbi:MAG: transglutaminase-like domain-containing protein [Isosphaeraceae bacterium]
MLIDSTKDAGIRFATFGMAALATACAELAIAEPGVPSGQSLARAALWTSLAAAAAKIARGTLARDVRGGGRGGGREATRAHAVVILVILVAFASPFAAEAARLARYGRPGPLEIVLISALRNLGLGLAFLSDRAGFARLAALVSLFLMLAASSVADGPLVLGLLSVYAAVGSLWLALAYWRAMDFRGGPEQRRRLPLGSLTLALGLIGIVGAFAAVGPTRAAMALAALVPSSGGTDQDDPDARGGVGDGDNEVRGSENPQSVGFTDSDIYLDSDRPTLYDAFNEMYGEPVKPKQQHRMVALGNQNVIEQRERPSENLQAGREFSAVRRSADQPGRRPADREARALVYVKGPTPLHLPLATYDRFDGHQWLEEPLCERHCPLTRDPADVPWFRIDQFLPEVFSGKVAHQIKIGTLDSSPLPTPAHVHRLRIGQVDRADFFGWSHEGILRMVSRTVPSGTVIETEARVPDPALLRAQGFPTAAYAASRHLGMDDGREIPAAIAALARSWAAEVPRGWGQVEAIVARLRGHATHDNLALVPPDCPDATAHFLLESRRGPDYLFAGAAAVLLRSLGYPTRLVSGLYAAPERYDARTRHTPVTREDVHVWAEVRLHGGAWVAVEPTPGYELMAPVRSWSDLLLAALAAVGRRAKSNASLLALGGVALLSAWRFRRELGDALATLAWEFSQLSDPRLGAIRAFALLERRARWAGWPRPPGRTPRRWFRDLAARQAGGTDGLERLINLAEWGMYAPADSCPPGSGGDLDPREACRRAVRAWPLSRFRAASRAII